MAKIIEHGASRPDRKASAEFMAEINAVVVAIQAQGGLDQSGASLHEETPEDPWKKPLEHKGYTGNENPFGESGQ